MGRVTPLTDNKIKTSKPKPKEYKIADGDGLYLHIKPNGSKLWRYRYTLHGASSTKAVGKYPLISLKEAREKRDAYHKMVLCGEKPTDVVAGKKDGMMFRELLAKYHEHRSDLSQKYIDDSESLIENHFKSILDMDIDSIDVAMLIPSFMAMEDKGIKTSTKDAGGLINRAYRYGTTRQYTINNPMLSIDLTLLLKKHEPENFAHITDEGLFKELLLAIDNFVGDMSTKIALQFMPYVFMRPYNIRFMLWTELNLKKKVWSIPGEKMKMKRDHVVPLTDSMIAILDKVKDNGSIYVFPSPQSKHRALSENTLNVALKRLGFKDVMTSHGFRHTASTFMHENIHKHGVQSDAIEMQLSHVESNSIKGIYNKALYMEERERLMQWWTDYLDALKRERDS